MKDWICLCDGPRRVYVRLDKIEAVWERPDFATEVQVGGESFLDMRTMEDLLRKIGAAEEIGEGRGMSHTPGPWRRYRDKTGRVSKIEGRGRRVCTFQPSDLNAEANASLIAAAPEMLEALEYAIAQVPELASVPGIEAAIRKARGEE